MPKAFASTADTQIQQPLGKGRLESLVDGFLDMTHREGGAAGDGRGQVHGFLQIEFHRDDAIHQMVVQGFVGGEEAAVEGHFHGHGLANGPHQALGAARAGHDAQVDLGLPEAGAFRGNDHVAGHGQFVAAAQTPARHRGDDWDFHRLKPLPQRQPVAEQLLNDIALRKFLDVSARGEGFFVAREHDDANVGIGIESLRRFDNAADHVTVQGVEALGPVDANEANVVVGFGKNWGHDGIANWGFSLALLATWRETSTQRGRGRPDTRPGRAGLPAIRARLPPGRCGPFPAHRPDPPVSAQPGRFAPPAGWSARRPARKR